MKSHLNKRKFSIITHNNSIFPYFLGGFNKKVYPTGQTFNSFKEFLYNYDEYNHAKDLNIFPFIRFKLKISNEFENLLESKYIIYCNELVKLINVDNDFTITNSNLYELLKLSFYNKLIHQFQERKIMISNNSREIENHYRYKLIQNLKGRNRFFVDKIFIHLSSNPDDINGYIKKVDNIVSKNITVFHYSENSKKIIIRLSVWAKLDNFIIKKESPGQKKRKDDLIVNDLTIHDEEWHHIIFEFEDSIDKLNYLQIFPNYSFPKFMKRFLSYLYDSPPQTSKIPTVKIADFDFFIYHNKLAENESHFKNEYHYLLNNY